MKILFLDQIFVGCLFLVMKLKEIAEKLPLEVSENIMVMHAQVESFLKTSENRSKVSSSLVVVSSENDQPHLTNEGTSDIHDRKIENVRDDLDLSQNAVDGGGQNDSKSSVAASKEATAHHSIEHGPKAESTEQFEPGVYVTFIQSSDGTKLFSRVRFRYASLF